VKKHFPPEFLNRLDDIVCFDPLAKGQLVGVARLMAAELNDRLAPKNISLAMTDAALEYAVASSFDPAYGARPLRRWLEHHMWAGARDGGGGEREEGAACSGRAPGEAAPAGGARLWGRRRASRCHRRVFAAGPHLPHRLTPAPLPPPISPSPHLPPPQHHGPVAHDNQRRAAGQQRGDVRLQPGRRGAVLLQRGQAHAGRRDHAARRQAAHQPRPHGLHGAPPEGGGRGPRG
jgi:hypothetical protein